MKRFKTKAFILFVIALAVGLLVVNGPWGRPGSVEAGPGTNWMSVDADITVAGVQASATLNGGDLFDVRVGITRVRGNYDGYAVALDYDHTILEWVPTVNLQNPPPELDSWLYLSGVPVASPWPQGNQAVTGHAVGVPTANQDRLLGGDAFYDLNSTQPAVPVEARFRCIGAGTSALHLVTPAETNAVFPGYTTTFDLDASGAGYDIPTTLTDATITCNGRADLILTKGITIGSSMIAGDVITWRNDIYNYGPTVARNVRLEDDWSAQQMEFVDAMLELPGQAGMVPLGCNPIPGSAAVMCPLGDVPVTGGGAHPIVFVDMRIKPTVPDGTVITNNAWLFSDTVDPDESSGHERNDTANGTVIGAPNLAVTKTVSAGPWVAGTDIAYTVHVANTGPVGSDALNVVVEDRLPAGVSIVSVVSPGTCVVGVPGNAALPTVCTIGTVAGGATANIGITVHIDPAVAAGTILTNDAKATTSSPESDLSDNQANNVTAVVSAEADLGLVKFLIGSPVAGSDVHYEYQIRNYGPSVSHDVTLRDFLPSQVEFLRAFVDYSGGTGGVPLPCDVTVGSNALMCPLGDVAPTGSFPISVYVDVHIKPGATGNLVNAADVNLKDTPDPAVDPHLNMATLTVAVVAAPNLAVTKTVSAGPWVAGTDIAYTVLVNNNGGAPADNVVVEDRLPAGVSIVSVVSPGTCVVGVPGNAALPTVCTIGTVANGATVAVGITVHIDPAVAAGTILTNDAKATTSSPESDLTDNTANNVTAVVSTSADLEMYKWEQGTPVAGSIITYELGVWNHGPSVSHGVYVADYLPPQVQFVDAYVWYQGAAGGVPLPCDVKADNTVICPLGDLAVSATERIAVFLHVRIKPDAPAGIITNSALLFPTTPDPGPLPNSASVDVTVVTGADLGITKTDRPDPVMAGGELFYDITVTNYGPATAVGAVVTDTLPITVPPLTFLADDLPGAGNCTAVANVLTCGPLPDIPLGGSVTFSIKVGVPASLVNTTPNPGHGIITNVAAVGGALPADPVSANNSVSQDTVVQQSADLRLTKECKPDDPLLVGGTATCTILVDNLGPSDALGVVVSDLHVSNGAFTITSATYTPPDGPDAGTCVIAGGLVTCHIGIEPAGGRTTITVTLTSLVPADVNDIATVASSTPDPNQGNNIAGDGVTFVEMADLKVTKLCKPDEPLPAGVEGDCTILVDNLGPSTATNVVLRDTSVSNGTFTFGAITTDVGACLAPAGGVVTCNLGNMAPNARATIHVHVSALQPQDINDDADVTSATLDPNLLNNQSQDGFHVVAVSDLVVTKTDAPDPVTAGTNLTYIVGVTNNGPSTATNVVIADVLPAQVTLVSIAPPAGVACNSGVPGDPAQPLTCNVGNLTNGASASITIVVTVKTDVPVGTVLTNGAAVSSNSVDSNTANNVVHVTTTVGNSADLSIDKTGPASQVAGTTRTFSMAVDNAGPSVAHHVIVTDTVPAGMQIVSATVVNVGPSVCQISNVNLPHDQVRCDLGDLPAGAAGHRVVSVDVLVNPDVPNGTHLVDSAVVSSDTSDPGPGLNSDSVDTQVVAAPNLQVTKSDSPDPVTAGTNLTYTVTVANIGGAPALDVVLEDRLPAGVSIVSITTTQGSCAAGVPGDPLLPNVCTMGTINNGASVTVTIVVFVDPSVPALSILTNDAKATTSSPDPDLTNNVDSETTTVATSANLSIVKTGPLGTDGVSDLSAIRGGETKQFHVRVTNGGPSWAVNVHVIDVVEETAPLDSGLRIVAFQAPAQCSIQAGGLNMDCALGDMAPGAFVDLYYDVKATVVRPDDVYITNTATVSSPTSDPSSANNTSSQTTEWTEPLDGGADPLHDFPCVFRDPVRGTALGVDVYHQRVRFTGPIVGSSSYDTGVIPAQIRTSVGNRVRVVARTKLLLLTGAGVCSAGPGTFTLTELRGGPVLYIRDMDTW